MSALMENILVRRPLAATAARELDIIAPLLLIGQVMERMFADDSDLLQEVFSGAVAGWQKFVSRYANVLYRASGKYCDDYDEKMAVFLHILEKLREDRFARLRGFKGEAKLSTWLTVVARRLALDFLRAKYGRDFRLKKIRVVSYDAVPAFMKHLVDHGSPERELAGAEQQQARQRLARELELVLQGLTAQERLAIQLVYFKGLKIKEAGKLLRLPSAYKFIARVLERIRAQMESGPRFSRSDVSSALGEEAHE